jgi:hypothetical protein
VQQISGDRNHYINKVFDDTCFQQEYSQNATTLPPSVAKALMGARVARYYLVIQVSLANTAREAVQLLTAQFESITHDSNGQVLTKLSDVQPVDVEFLMATAQPRQNIASIIQFDPVILGRVLLPPKWTGPVFTVWRSAKTKSSPPTQRLQGLFSFRARRCLGLPTPRM